MPELSQRFNFLSSRSLAVALAAMTGLALAVLLLVQWPIWAGMLLAVLLMLNLWHSLRHYAWLLAPASCVGLEVNSGGVILVQRDGRCVSCEISQDSLVTPYLAALNISVEGSRFARSILILPDAMDQDAFRQLRVWLKWELSARGAARRREHGGRA